MRLALVVLAGCTGAPGSGAFDIDGNISGTGATGSIVVVWDVAAATPYTYKFGDGMATSPTSFVASLVGAPPAGAMNSNGLAVGYVVMLPSGTHVDDGIVDLRSTRIGDSAEYGVIWKSGTETVVRPWEATFGANYSCAHCVRSVSGSQPDSFELTACANVTVVMPAAPTCSWF
jgi:hypothetical protein